LWARILRQAIEGPDLTSILCQVSEVAAVIEVPPRYRGPALSFVSGEALAVSHLVRAG
jgi:hypothetical protein